MKPFNKNDDLKTALFLEKLRESLEMGSQDRARLREAILAKASITPQAMPQSRPEAKTFFGFTIASFSKTAAVVVLVFAGFSGIVYASGSALPGNLLYPVKLAKEAVELRLAATPLKRASVLANHAEIRLQEIQELQANHTLGTPPQPVSPEIRQQAAAQVRSAMRALSGAEDSLNRQGNSQQAAAVQAQIEDLRQHVRQAGEEMGGIRAASNAPEGQQASGTQQSLITNQNSGRLQEQKNKQATSTGATAQSAGNQNFNKDIGQSDNKNSENSRQILSSPDTGGNKLQALPTEASTSTPQAGSAAPQTKSFSATSSVPSAVTASSTQSATVLQATTTPPRAESGDQGQTDQQSSSLGAGSASSILPHDNYENGGDNKK